MKATTERALEELKLRAAALGAEAVVNTEFEHGEGGDAVTHLSGMAVRCRDLLNGRAYDVIGEVKVQGPFGQALAPDEQSRWHVPPCCTLAFAHTHPAPHAPDR